MKRRNIIHVVLAVCVLLVGAPAWAMEVLKTDKATMNVDGRLHLLGLGQKLDDPVQNDVRVYLFLDQARLSLSGNYEDYRYKLQLAFGGEEEIRQLPPVSLSLLDLYADIPLPGVTGTYLRAGQYKIPYGRERLMDSGMLLFARRSMANDIFIMGRDVGLTLTTQQGVVNGAIGVFAGGGRDVFTQTVPQKLGIPQIVARVGYNGGIDTDVFATPSTGKPEGIQAAVHLNGLYTKESILGGLPLSMIRSVEKGLLINPAANPFIAQQLAVGKPAEQGTIWQVGADAAIRTAVGDGTVSAEAEFNYGTYSNKDGEIKLMTGRAQVGYAWKELEVAARYAMLLPDDKLALGYMKPDPNAPSDPTKATPAQIVLMGKDIIHEVTPGLTYHFGKHAKIVLDLPILLDAPVGTATGFGSLVMAEHSPETLGFLIAEALKYGAPVPTIARQTVIEGRALLQARF